MGLAASCSCEPLFPFVCFMGLATSCSCEPLFPYVCFMGHVFEVQAVHVASAAHVVYKVGQNRVYIPFVTVCSVISLPKTPYIHHYIYGTWFWLTLIVCAVHGVRCTFLACSSVSHDLVTKSLT